MRASGFYSTVLCAVPDDSQVPTRLRLRPRGKGDVSVVDKHSESGTFGLQVSQRSRSSLTGAEQDGTGDEKCELLADARSPSSNGST